MCDHAGDTIVPVSRVRVSLCNRRILSPASCMQLRRLHLMRSWTGGAAADFYLLRMHAAIAHRAYTPWQPYADDTYGPLVSPMVLVYDTQSSARRMLPWGPSLHVGSSEAHPIACIPSAWRLVDCQDAWQETAARAISLALPVSLAHQRYARAHWCTSLAIFSGPALTPNSVRARLLWWRERAWHIET